MEIIPLIRFYKRSIFIDEEGEPSSLQTLTDLFQKETLLYCLDLDGIEKEKPNLCSYPKLSKHFSLWVDAGPRNLGDIVDAVLAGAQKITVRTSLWQNFDSSKVRDITECELFVDFDPKCYSNDFNLVSFQRDVDGVIILNRRERLESDFTSRGSIRALCTQCNLYVYETNPKQVTYWKNMGISGLIVDVKKEEEFKKHEQ
jgi:hypothetical protein